MAQVDLGGNTYDSYVSVEDAGIYLAGDVARADGWAALSEDSQGRALVSSTRMMQTLPWCDVPPDPAVDPAPLVVQQVTAMLGADLAAKPKLFADASGSSNVKRVQAGSAEVEFWGPVAGAAPIPQALWDMLEAAGLVCMSGKVDSGAGDPFVSGIMGREGCRPLGGRYPWDWPLAAADYD